MGIDQLESFIKEGDLEGIRKLARLKVPDDECREEWAEQLLERARDQQLSASLTIVMLDAAVKLDREIGPEAVLVLSERCASCAHAARANAGKTEGPAPKTSWKTELMQFQTQLVRAARMWS